MPSERPDAHAVPRQTPVRVRKTVVCALLVLFAAARARRPAPCGAARAGALREWRAVLLPVRCLRPRLRADRAVGPCARATRVRRARQTPVHGHRASPALRVLFAAAATSRRPRDVLCAAPAAARSGAGTALAHSEQLWRRAETELCPSGPSARTSRSTSNNSVIPAGCRFIRPMW